ncbi:MAG: acyltransferase family protein [Ignavibacteriales bacterium]
MKYRPEIDGLRALAVLPITLFHFGVPGFGGGYVGVDIFYVISGFLITGIIAPQMSTDRFTFGDFYERRVRRLFPALFAMLAVVGLVCLAILLPRDLAAFGRSVVATLVFASNILFWREANYFDTESELKPLLHTWSLGVEEQFYLAFPIFLVVALKLFRKRTPLVVAGVAALSFALNLAMLSWRPAAAFYLSPPRAWELLLGALLFLTPPPKPGRFVAETVTLAGLVAIGVAVVAYTPLTPFPGWAALLPCLGAAAIIYAGREAPASASALTNAPMRFVGKISYSLYLWHWPVAALYRYRTGHEPRGLVDAVLLAVVVALAALSWRFVEEPVRRRQLFARRGVLWGASGAAAAVLGAVALTVAFGGGLAGRFPANANRLEAFEDDKPPAGCGDIDPGQVRADVLCRIGAPGVAPTLVVWGDSHAWALQGAYDEMLRNAGRSAWLITRSGCPPVTGLVRINYPAPCTDFADRAMRFIADQKPQAVIIVANWPTYALDSHVVDARSGSPSDAESAAAISRAMRGELLALKRRGIEVILQDPMPGARRSAPRALAQRIVYGPGQEPAAYTAEEYLQRNRAYFDMVRTNADLIEGRLQPQLALCATGTCEVEGDGLPLYFDNNHARWGSSRLLARTMQPQLDALVGKTRP